MKKQKSIKEMNKEQNSRMSSKEKNRYGHYRSDSAGHVEEREESFVVVGKNPVQEALRADMAMDKLLVLKDNKDHALGDITEKARKRGVIVHSVEKTKLDKLSEGRPHQGIVAIMAPFPYADLEDILAKAAEKQEEPLIVVLDHIMDPHNLGAVIRSANLCGVHGVIIPNRRAATLTPAAVKASAGAISYVPVVKTGNLSQCLADLKAKGFWIASADMDGTPYYKTDYCGKMAIVIGNEGKGIGPKIRNESDYIVSIPIYGDIDSFNASAAAAIILAEAAKQRHLS